MKLSFAAYTSMAALARRLSRLVAMAVSLVAMFALPAGPAQAQTTPSKQLAPGFQALTKGEKVVVLPVDVELFSLSAGGVPEPRADWTAQAQQFMNAELKRRLDALALQKVVLDQAAADEFADQVALHAAVAQAVALHHGVGGMWALPTKDGKLDWSFHDAMLPLQQKTGARYGLFVWVRDSYASAERKAAIFAMALLTLGNVALSGGSQVGYASLVDLETGRLLWFNRLFRGSGDLREEKSATETTDTLLTGFPSAR